MPRRTVSILTAALIVLGARVPAFAHRGPVPPGPPDQEEERPAITLEKVSDRVYCIFGTGGNVGFLVSDSGVLVVDDQYENVAQDIVDRIRTVTDRPIRYLVNTHYHSDHTGGNPVFVKFADLIAHDNVRPRLLEYPETVRRTFPARIQAVEKEIASIADPADPWRAALEKDLGLLKYFLSSAEAFTPASVVPPGITFEGHVKVWLEGEEVHVFHVAPGHTDGDSMVYFRTENVLHTGDLMFNGLVPFVDVLAGGSVEGLVENLDYALRVVSPSAKVIPGHGPVTDVAGLRRFRDFLADLRGKVAKAVKAGMSKADAARAITMEEYPEIKPGFRTLGNLVGAAYDEIKAAP